MVSLCRPPRIHSYLDSEMLDMILSIRINRIQFNEIKKCGFVCFDFSV